MIKTNKLEHTKRTEIHSIVEQHLSPKKKVRERWWERSRCL